MTVINKTYMASLAKRKEKVNQLRKAHFPFGFDANQNVSSEYVKEYQAHSVDVAHPTGNRSNNFSIGSDEPNMAKHTYESEFKQQYPEYPTQGRTAAKRLNDENNIVFGFDGDRRDTNYKQEFPNKEGDRGQVVNQKLVHVALGDALSDFSTSYKNNFDGAPADPQGQVANKSRDSNLVFGFGDTGYQTSNHAAHNSKPVAASKPVERTYGNNILLGADAVNYHSEQKTKFAHKEAGYQTVDKERVRDFKKAHFQMGFPEGQQQESLSEAQTNYNTKPLAKLEVSGRKPTNVELRVDDNNYFQSSYGQHYQNKPAPPAEIMSGNGRSDNVVIGMGSGSYNSEAKDQFNSKPIQRVSAKRPEGSLELGDGGMQYSTQYGHTHTDKFGQAEPNRISKEQIDHLKKENFVKGFSGVDYKLHSMGYGQGRGEANQLSRETIDKMRTTNVVYGTAGFDGKSIKTSSYGWKKNDDF